MPKIRFGNVDFSGDGAYIWGAGEYSAPTRSVDMIEIPGRSGDLIIDNGSYNNTTARFGVVITKDVPQNTDRLKYLLYSQKGYQRLYDSDLKGFYRMAAFSAGFDLTETDAGVVHLEFDCKPFKYDILGDDFISFTEKEKEYNLHNKYFETAKPLIKVYGTGDGDITIGDKTIHFYDIEERVTVDTEMQDAFDGYVNRNNFVSSADASLVFGENKIVFSGNISRIEIAPRWVTI